jgi:nicotinate phosphoribosyltransferase
LNEIGERAVGIRLDSGDLAYLSKEARKLFKKIAEAEKLPGFANLTIFASNDIDESVLMSLNQQGHEVDAFGIGTHLVTCKAQPALGCVYKLVAINDHPRMKLSDEVEKMTIPGRKEAYRLIGEEGQPLLDVMIEAGKQPPEVGRKILCRHPYNEAKRAYVVPKAVVPLHRLVWDGKQSYSFPPLIETRAYVIEQIKSMRPDHIRSVNATPYKISVSEELYDTIHTLWMREAPIAELS